VVQGVADDHVVGAGEGRDRADVRRVPGGEEQRVLRPEPVREGLLGPAMDLVLAGDEPGGTGPSRARSDWPSGKAEVVVAGECGLRRGAWLRVAEEPSALQLVELGREVAQPSAGDNLWFHVKRS